VTRAPGSSAGSLLLCAVLCACAVAGAEDLEVRAELTPETIGVEQLATLTITVDGGGARRLRPAPDFELENLDIVAGPYSQESFQFSNGATSRTASISWRVRPRQIGTARVHSMVVRVAGRVVELADLEITVQEEPVETEDPGEPIDPFDRLFDPFLREPTRRRPQPSGEVFLRATAQPAEAYVGQQVLYTLYLYTQNDISSINPESLPEFQGFWVREVPQPKRYELEKVDIDGKPFARVKLLERALFPLREGEFELEPTRALMAVKVPSSSGFSLLSQTEEIQRVSNPVKLTVRPLPSPPQGFTGAVGDLELRSTLEPSTIEAGEATTLSIELTGRGLLQVLPDPELPELPGLEIYPPQESSSDEVRRGQVYGSRTWSWVLIPERPGPIDIPPIELPYFDPRQSRYQVASSEPVRLEVVPSVRTAGRVASDDRLHPIRNAALPVAGAMPAWIGRLPAWMMSAALLGLVATWVVRRSDRFGPQHRQALHAFEDRLHDLGRTGAHGRIAAELETAWREFLRDRWDVSPGTATGRWHDELRGRGASDAAGSELARLVEDLHYLRYAPQLSSNEALEAELVQRSRQILKSLR
jgi:hypothetical protein